MKRVATVILNRNLPDVTDALVEHILRLDGDMTDIYVVESGSDADKLSRYCTWHVNDETTAKQGLRYARGMNYALCELWKSGRLQQYDAVFLLTNDTELGDTQTIAPLLHLLDAHKRVGILSPCSQRWGEKYLIGGSGIKYFWFIHNNAYMLRREFILALCEAEDPNYMNFLYDGENFRGFLLEEEIIAKAYANNWAAAITNQVWVAEDESHLLEKNKTIKTESYGENLRLYVEEGCRWVKKKYGFPNKWVMQQYVRQFYESFFQYFPEFVEYKIG